jgi:hypothetical protein
MKRAPLPAVVVAATGLTAASCGRSPASHVAQLGSTTPRRSTSSTAAPSQDGGRPTQAQVQQYRSVMLAYARCMRRRGVVNMPDPDSRGHLEIGPGTGIDVNSTRFQGAFHVCSSRLSP